MISDLPLAIHPPLDQMGGVPSWPVNPDFIVSTTDRGQPRSVASDWAFDLSEIGGRPIIISFHPVQLGMVNAGLLRSLALWWLFKRYRSISATSVKSYIFLLLPIFRLCTENKISGANLFRHPRVVARLANCISKSGASTTIALLHEILGASPELGFKLLDKESLRCLSALLPNHSAQQTPYIPPRIWLYQVERLRAFLEDFWNHRSALEGLFEFCLDGYVDSFGSLAKTSQLSRGALTQPFTYDRRRRGKASYRGTFKAAAEKFGLVELFERWIGRRDHPILFNVSTFSHYFQITNLLGICYIMNFTGMRAKEALSLKHDCLEVEHDPQLGDIYLLRSATTKTVEDEGALWVTSPSVKLAIDVVGIVARLRIGVASAYPELNMSQEDVSNYRLTMDSYEPWSCSRASRSTTYRPHESLVRIGDWARICPKIFDAESLVLTQSDINVARSVNPTLDPEIFDCGKPWKFASHQFRRTLSVNMTASGSVSHSSLQYQLKHVTRAQSLYYGQGFSHLRLSDKDRATWVRSHYEALSRQAESVLTDRYVSPLGNIAKRDLVAPINLAMSASLLQAARSGKVAMRETLLGLCMRRGPCPFGGLDDIRSCANCTEALVDREKYPELLKLRAMLVSNLSSAPLGSPLANSLSAQLRSATEALNAIEH